MARILAWEEIVSMCEIFAGQHVANYEASTRRLRLNGQSTSIRLENLFWESLDRLAESEGLTTPAFVSKLHSEVLLRHGEARNFTSMLRCCCLIFMQREGVPQIQAAE
jgi:predicted DNA-binding ribbon-helix-helix protein